MIRPLPQDANDPKPLTSIMLIIDKEMKGEINENDIEAAIHLYLRVNRDSPDDTLMLIKRAAQTLMEKIVNSALKVSFEIRDAAEAGKTIPSLTDERLYTVIEVAKILKVERQTVNNYINTNKLTAIKLSPRHQRIQESALNEFLRSRQK